MRFFQHLLRPHSQSGIRQDPEYGFLHIGKTGGTTIASLLNEAASHNYRTPRVLGHDYSMKQAMCEFPNIKLSVTIRDPIERIISGFNSRLRQSRPSYTALWKSEEAVAYLWFPTVTDFFNAKISDNERLKSAALWAEQAMGHVRRGYVYHFESPEFLEQNKHRLYFVGKLDDLSRSAFRYLEPCGVPKSFCDDRLVRKHCGAGTTQSSRDTLCPDLVKTLRDIYADEYAIYDKLLSIAK
ncbi:MAG: sulfotransferase family 2 domain-containing protein [Roseibium sp.]